MGVTVHVFVFLSLFSGLIVSCDNDYINDALAVKVVQYFLFIQYTFDTQYTHVTDRRTDKRTDGQTELPWHIRASI